MILDAKLVENFAGVFLSEGYSDPQPTPLFHRECWDLYCSTTRLVAVAAPRGHAKSTALTHDFGLAALLFRFTKHLLIVSSTEELAMAQLGDMSKELRDNEDLRHHFGVVKLEVDSKGEVICRCDDGHRFRIIARGVEQRVRGMKWHGQRPDLILMDDVEEDEQVASIDRRRKLSRWINRALIPAAAIGARIRWHGTLLHHDAMLARVMRSKVWTHRLYKAHESYDDFTNQLWPERRDSVRGMNNEEILREVRAQFEDDQDTAGYCQEYLNDPRADEIAYIKDGWFQPIPEDEEGAPGVKAAGIDFAISKADAANRTSITIGNMGTTNLLDIIDQSVGKMDGEEIVSEMIRMQRRHHLDFFFVESGQIWLSIKATLRKEMMRTGVYINYIERTPIKDKAARGRSFQKRMKCGGVRWDYKAEWFPGMKAEILNFSEVAEAQLDDQFDSVALLSKGLEEVADVEPDDLMDEEEEEFRMQDPNLWAGRNPVTGY